jgi:2-dehydro-3-deoxyphosphooctonate aldolase (KDO 8-P synthase)
MKQKIVEVGYGDVKKVKIGGELPLVFVGGPCAIENKEHAMMMADRIGEVCDKIGIEWIYKSCFDKDCRSAPTSFHGCGLDVGLDILSQIRDVYKVPVVSDFSDPAWASATGEVCDLVQVPAYLCRQTSILRAAAKTSRPILLKKGQFMSPWNMKNSVRKLEAHGCNDIILADRGTFLGYNMLVNDMTSFPIMAETGYPVCYDASHSIQLPTSMGNISGGQREFIPYLVRSAVANGINLLFMETHDNPDKALSDANTVVDIKYLENILYQAKVVHQTRLDLLKELGPDNIHPRK